MRWFAAHATMGTTAPWCPAAVGAKVTLTSRCSLGPRVNSSGVTLNAEAAPSGGQALLPSRTCSWLDGAVSTLVTVKLELAVAPGATAANSSGAGTSTLIRPGVHVSQIWGHSKSCSAAASCTCPSSTVSVTVRLPGRSGNRCIGRASSDGGVPSPKSQ